MKEQDLFNNAEYLLSLALKKTNNYEQAEDLVSETLISALVSLRDGKSIDNFKAYLSVILNHKFNDFLRSKYSKPTIYYGVIPEYDFASNEKSAEDQLIQEEEAAIPLIAPKFFETIDKYREYIILSKEPDPEMFVKKIVSKN